MKKKICFVINSLENGGAERVLVNLVNSLPSNLFDITVFSLYSSGIYDGELKDYVRYSYVFKEHNKILKRLLLILICKGIPLRLLHRIYIGNSFDYEVAFLQGVPTEIVRVSKNTGSKKIAFIHSDFATNYDLDGFYKSTSICLNHYRLFDKVCFVSNKARNGFISKIGQLNNDCVVHNVMNVKKIISDSKIHVDIDMPFDSTYRVISVGRLIELKSYDRLIEATNNAIKSGVRLVLYIIGDGPERAKLEKLTKDLGIDEHVCFLGYQRNPYKYLVNSDLYVCSSITEGYSTSVIEALILGIPVITTNVSGMDEIIGNSKAGIIVENTVEGLTLGMIKVLSDSNMITRMKNAAEIRGKEFSTDSQVQEFINMIAEL